MQLFYTTGNDFEWGIFGGEECLHLGKSLRKQRGEIIHWTDGKGHLYEGEIFSIERQTIKARILKCEKQERKHQYELTLAVAPTKQADRIEWMLEKAIEVGLDRFIPILCAHSEQSRLRIDRLERIAISAMKQSQQFYLPVISEMIPFSDFLIQNTAEQSYIAHCVKQDLPFFPNLVNPNGQISVCIGPEGDFNASEIREAIGKGYQEISLGNTRLRTETAALAACMHVQSKSIHA